jgi:hypothetical protein
MQVPDNLTQAETRLLIAAKEGEIADFTTGDPERDNPAGGADWEAERMIRAEVLRALCLGAWPEMNIGPKGIRIKGAHVTGVLDLETTTLGFPLRLTYCHISCGLAFVGAEVKLLDLRGTHCLGGIQADGLRASHSVWLGHGFLANGTVSLIRARLGGHLFCEQARFRNRGSIALQANFAEILGVIALRNGFVAEGEVSLFGARVGSALDCTGGRFENPKGTALDAESAQVSGPVHLGDGFTALGTVRLYAATISGNLQCNGGRFVSSTEALNADAVHISGGALLRNEFAAEGEVRFCGAKIGIVLDCSSGHFKNFAGVALNAEGAEIGGPVLLRNDFVAEGEVRLRGTKIGGDVECNRGRFTKPGSIALNAELADISGAVLFFNRFSAVGGVRFFGAKIRALQADGGRLSSPGGVALNLELCTVGGPVLLRNDFRAHGEVRVRAATIAGDLDCAGSHFINPSSAALNGESADVRGAVLLRYGFEARGETRLFRAKIGGGLECDAGHFVNPGGTAFQGDGLHVNGAVLLRNGFVADGEVRFYGAQIDGDVNCGCGHFTNSVGAALCFRLARITDALVWEKTYATGFVDLHHASVQQLVDTADSWPPRKFDIIGFEYSVLAGRAPTSATERINWLSNQDGSSPQPYEHLVRVLRRMGHENDARKVAIAKQVMLRRSGQLSGLRRISSLLLGAVVAYGYKPGRAFGIALALVALGWATFAGADRLGVMARAKESAAPTTLSAGPVEVRADYPPFVAPLYSLDVFLPVVNLRQEDYWLPHPGKPWGRAFWFYMWFHILAGWSLTTILVAALSGLIKKD